MNGTPLANQAALAEIADLRSAAARDTAPIGLPMLSRHITLLGAFASTLLGLLSCAPPSEGGAPTGPVPFQFRTSVPTPFEAEVRLAGEPLAHVVLQLHGRTEAPFLPAPEPEFDDSGEALPVVVPDMFEGELDLPCGGGLLFVGATDAQGRLNGDFPSPASMAWFDVIISRAGTEGPVSDPDWKLDAGPFGPSSRTTWSRDGLLSIVIDLEEVQP